jgi:glycosyltransferase involved in cell wall biosynthesis
MNLKEASSGRSMSDEGVATRPVVAIYADPLLAPSMPWVRAQAEALRNFSPVYVGPRFLQTGGLELPRERVITIHHMTGIRGRIREAPFKVFGFAPIFFNRLRAARPRLVQAHCGPASLMATRITRALGIPLIATFHGSEVTGGTALESSPHYAARVYARHRGFVAREARLCLAVSQFLRERMLQEGFPENKTIVHYIGVDTRFFCPDPKVEREPVVLFTGQLWEVKGCGQLIAAMARVQAELPEAELVVIGDGRLRESLETAARAHLGRFRFLGTQPPEVVRNWMNRAQVFCVPSAKTPSGATEAFGIVFAEAQAMQLPVVSRASGGIVEAVADGKTGILVKERDDYSLADSILFLLRNETVRRNMGAAGRERVCAEFDLHRQTRKLEALYGHILDEAAEESNGKASGRFAQRVEA